MINNCDKKFGNQIVRWTLFKLSLWHGRIKKFRNKANFHYKPRTNNPRVKFIYYWGQTKQILTKILVGQGKSRFLSPLSSLLVKFLVKLYWVLRDYQSLYPKKLDKYTKTSICCAVVTSNLRISSNFLVKTLHHF